MAEGTLKLILRGSQVVNAAGKLEAQLFHPTRGQIFGQPGTIPWSANPNSNPPRAMAGDYGISVSVPDSHVDALLVALADHIERHNLHDSDERKPFFDFHGFVAAVASSQE